MKCLALLLLLLSTFLCFSQTKEDYKKWKEAEKQGAKERKEREREAASSTPSVSIKAPADKVKVFIISRIDQWGGFSLVADSNYQLRFQRNVRWANVWDGLAHESTSSRPTKEGLALTFLEENGVTTISSDRSVTRESNYGNTQTDSMNRIGKWNLELQHFLNDAKDHLEKQPIVLEGSK